ncbi:succinate dehydrogenase iron-sulfur subunit [candidate division KSB1 bacterium]|nr:succinate dehydrogenase iron-sulfur subunit [candidate division KSB1 bacterium]
MKLNFRVLRFNPEKETKPRYQDFEVVVGEGWTVLDAMNEIKWHHDGSLSFRRSCREGICGSCAMKINGINSLACETRLEDLKSKRITVEPLPSLPIIRDLVVEMYEFYNSLTPIKPYLINPSPPPDKERIQSPEDQQVFDGSVNCILCGACTTSCPSFWANHDYLGPAALLKAFRFEFDSRDGGTPERLPSLDSKYGLWRCHTIFNCVNACPKKININDAIGKLKRKVISEKF